MLVNVIFLVITLTHLVGCQDNGGGGGSSSTTPSLGQQSPVARSLPPTGGNVNRCSGQWRFPANCRSASCQYLCQWKFNQERDQVDFTLSTNRPDKWVGVGFSRDSKMPGTDVIVAWVEPGSRYVMMDAWLDSYSIPIPDTKQSVQNISAAAANGLISFSFSRPLKTGDDTHDLDFDECLHFVFPVGGGPVDTKQRLVMKHERTPMISPNKLCFNSCRAKVSPTTPSITSSTQAPISPSYTPSTRTPYTRTRIRTTSTTTTTTTAIPAIVSTEAPTTKYSNFDYTSDTSSLNDKLKKKGEGQATIVTKEDELILVRKKEGGLNQASSSNSDDTSLSSKEKTINQPVEGEGENGESITDCKGEWKYPSKCSGYGCDYKAIWEYIDDLDEIMFTVSTKNRNKWTGIGFSNDKSMPGTDAVLGLVEESGRFFLMDTYLRSYSAPPLDQVQNIHNMSVWRENGVTTLQFNRKRRTGDRSDFQFSDLNCPYFVFPVQGGVFNAINKRLRKHEETPIVSSHKICVKSCKSFKSTQPSYTTSRSTSSVQSSSSSYPSSSPATTSRPSISTVSTSTSIQVQSSSTSKKNINDNTFDMSQLGPNFPDLNKLSQGSKIDFSNVTAILSGMNLTSSDIPNLLKTFASKFPRNESVDPSTYFSIPPFVTSSTTSSTPSIPKSSSDFGGHDDTNTNYSDTPAIVVSSVPATVKPVYKRISPRTRAPSRWSSTTSTTTSTTTPQPPSSSSSSPETTDEGEDDEDENDDDTTKSTSTTMTSIQNEIEPESNYVIELKLPKAWKSVYARKKSEEYKTFSNHVEEEIAKELKSRFSNLEVKVMDLKSALDSSSSSLPLLEQQQHSLIAKLKLKIAPSKQVLNNNSSSGSNEVVRGKGESNNRSPETVKEALNLAIKDGRVGDFSVDSSYLIIRPFENDGQGPSDSESKDGDAFLTPQQLQWTLISVGLAALVLLLLIQCYCSCVMGKKNRTRNIQKDGKGVMANGHWRDHYNSNGHLAANGAPYTYENFGLNDDSDHLNGKLIHHHLMNGKSKQPSNNKDRVSNGHHHSSPSYPQNHHNKHYNNSSSHHNNNSDHHQSHHQQHQQSNHHHHRERGERGERERGGIRGAVDHPSGSASQQQHLSRHPQSNTSASTGIGLQPDFYFMPHQRRYSGEVVRVFVDYNKEQPK